MHEDSTRWQRERMAIAMIEKGIALHVIHEKTGLNKTWIEAKMRGTGRDLYQATEGV